LVYLLSLATKYKLQVLDLIKNKIMNEIILAYGLGILSIGTGVLVRMVFKAEKRVKEQEQLLSDIRQDFQQSIQSVHSQMKAMERSTVQNFEVVDRKIDSRIDKLEFKMRDQSEYIRNKTSQAY
jgi:hypothetical protein